MIDTNAIMKKLLSIIVILCLMLSGHGRVYAESKNVYKTISGIYTEIKYVKKYGKEPPGDHVDFFIIIHISNNRLFEYIQAQERAVAIYKVIKFNKKNGLIILKNSEGLFYSRVVQVNKDFYLTEKSRDYYLFNLRKNPEIKKCKFIQISNEKRKRDWLNWIKKNRKYFPVLY